MLTNLMRIFLSRSLKPFEFKGKYDNELDFNHLEDLGIYVHIPFCKEICSFCPYCKELFKKDRAINYKNALLKEIDLVNKNLSGKKEVASIYFGGGTPLLMVDNLGDIIEQLKKYYVVKGGIGVEIHPGDITDENMKKLRSVGVTMVSLGIQSFNSECLKKIGRRYDDFDNKIDLIKNHGFAVIDVDLIFGIPGQDDNILKEDILTAFNSGATQVSTYPFIDFTFADNEYKPLCHSDKKRMLSFLNDVCKDNEVDRTSVWTFAKKNTNKYSSITRDTFIGFGVSATSLLKNIFKINTFSIDGYIDRINEDNLATSLTLEFTQRQRALYYLFWGCYSLEIDKEKFKKIVGRSVTDMYGIEIALAKKLGYLTEDNSKYYLTDKASYTYHYIEQRYTTAYIDKMWNISRKIPFPEKIILK